MIRVLQKSEQAGLITYYVEVIEGENCNIHCTNKTSLNIIDVCYATILDTSRANGKIDKNNKKAYSMDVRPYGR